VQSAGFTPPSNGKTPVFLNEKHFVYTHTHIAVKFCFPIHPAVIDTIADHDKNDAKRERERDTRTHTHLLQPKVSYNSSEDLLECQILHDEEAPGDEEGGDDFATCWLDFSETP
jgi:hypothetical protein